MNCGFTFAVLYVVNKNTYLPVMECASLSILKKKKKKQNKTKKQKNCLSQSWLTAKTINKKF